jgi:hypothetical protein
MTTDYHTLRDRGRRTAFRDLDTERNRLESVERLSRWVSSRLPGRSVFRLTKQPASQNLRQKRRSPQTSPSGKRRTSPKEPEDYVVKLVPQGALQHKKHQQPAKGIPYRGIAALLVKF